MKYATIPFTLSNIKKIAFILKNYIKFENGFFVFSCRFFSLTVNLCLQHFKAENSSLFSLLDDF